MDLIKNTVLRSPLSEEKGEILQSLIEKGEITTEIAEIIGDLSCIGLEFEKALRIAKDSPTKKVGEPYEVYWSYLKKIENEKVFNIVDLKNEPIQCECGKEFYDLVEFENGLSEKLYAVRAVKFDKDMHDRLMIDNSEVETMDIMINESIKTSVLALSTYVKHCIPNMLLEKFLLEVKNFKNTVESDDIPIMSINDEGWLYLIGDDEFEELDIVIYASKSALERKPIKSTKPDIFETVDEGGGCKIQVRELDIIIENTDEFKVVVKNGINLNKAVEEVIYNYKSLWCKTNRRTA